MYMSTRILSDLRKITSQRNCQNQLSHPGSSHTKQECQESLIQGKIDPGVPCSKPLGGSKVDSGNSCRDAPPCANMALKLPQYFHLLMEKPLGRHSATRKHLFLYPQGYRSGLRKPKKG